MEEQLSIIKSLSEEAYDFIINHKKSDIEEGHYDLGNGVYVNVQQYMSKPREEQRFENHRKYIDVQLVIEGEEIIELFPVSDMQEDSNYDDEHDISFYSNAKNGKKIHLTKGKFSPIFPGQAHMPCVKADTSVLVKKAVVKIPVNRMPRLLFMDVDGTLTDGKIYMGKLGEEFKTFNIKDGYAIANILPKYNIIPVIITGRQSEIVSQRAEELGINLCLQGIKDKKIVMTEVANSFGLYMNEKGIFPRIAYIGDDIPDYDCMSVVEKKGCPQDAVAEIKQISDFISALNAGNGAVREFIEWLVCV